MSRFHRIENSPEPDLVTEHGRSQRRWKDALTYILGCDTFLRKFVDNRFVMRWTREPLMVLAATLYPMFRDLGIKQCENRSIRKTDVKMFEDNK